MAEIQMKLNGWQAIVVIIIVIGLIVVRLASFNDKTNNEELIQELEFQLMTEYFPDDVEHLKAVYESGDDDEVSDTVESITTTELTILSVQTSSPLLSFSSNQKVIVKVVYSLDDAFGNREQATTYYRFKHGGLLNTWRHMGRSGKTSYYLNFL